MTWHSPNFQNGMIGAANRVVSNRWNDSSTYVADRRDGIAWAQDQLVRPTIVASGLCSVKSATSLGVNRWTYTIEIWMPQATGGITVATDARFNYANARNLREEFNTITVVDGMDISAPPSTIGPVGSEFVGGAWKTQNLNARVHVWVVYDSGGTAVPFFDRANPIRCNG
jgi:hypothetical protein